MELFKKENKDTKQPETAADSTSPATDKQTPVSSADYQALIKERDELKDRNIRLYAEFENARRRFERDKAEFVKYASEGLLANFVGILDDLERSVEAASAKHQDYAAFLKGIEMVMAHIYDLLKKNDVKPIESVGKKFDPHCQEVLLQAPSTEHPDGTVLEELQKGYYLGDRVLRTAKVKVAVNPSAAETPSPEDQQKKTDEAH